MAPRICESLGCGTELRWWERITGCRRANEHGRLASAYYAVLIDQMIAARAKEAAERAKVPTPVINDDAQKLEKGESASTKAPMETIARQQDVEAAEQAKVPTPVINDDAQKLENGESASSKAPKETIAREQDVEAAEQVNVPAEADSIAVQEQGGSHPASIKDAQASTTRQVQNKDLAESLDEESWLDEASARLEAARMAGVDHYWGAGAAARYSSNEEEDLPRVRFPSSIETEHADRTDAAPDADPSGGWSTAVHGQSPKKKSSRRPKRCNHPQWDKVLGAGPCESRWMGRRRHFMPYFLYKCRRCQVRHCKWCAQRHGRLYD